MQHGWETCNMPIKRCSLRFSPLAFGAFWIRKRLMQNIQEWLLTREFGAKHAMGGGQTNWANASAREEMTQPPHHKTAWMSKHKVQKRLEIVLHPGTLIHIILEQRQMMEFLEFPVETSSKLTLTPDYKSHCWGRTEQNTGKRFCKK